MSLKIKFVFFVRNITEEYYRINNQRKRGECRQGLKNKENLSYSVVNYDNRVTGGVNIGG